jgi:porin
MRAVPAPIRRAALSALALALAASLPGPSRAEEEACESGQPLTAGLCLAAALTADALAVASGGIRQGAAAIAQARLGLAADLEKLAGLSGWTATLSGVGVFGRQPTPTLTGSLAPVSNIEALPTIRLYEAWLQRGIEGWGSIRVGQMGADSEFAVASAAGNLINGTFGWPVALAATLPAGGPAYPLTALGARLAVLDPEGGTGARLGLFAGNPGGRYGAETNPQAHNRYGTTFSTSGGAFMLAEAVTGAAAPEGSDSPRPWVLKLGGWFHNGGVDSVRFDDTGLPLADPLSSGVARRYRNNFGGYAIAEATLWRAEGTSVALFARGFAQPNDRNLAGAQLDGGLAWRGPFGRAGDTLSLGVSYARIGKASREADRDRQMFGEALAVRDHETVIELNYDVVVLANRLAIRPVAQFLVNPGGRVADDRRGGTAPIPDALVLGARLVATY